jgi:hypothetical protein
MAAKAAGSTFTITDYNQIDDNFQAGVPDIFTTKGDLAAATASNAAARVAVGANDATLVADSSQSTGMAWQIQPACHVYNDAGIDPATSTWVSLTFNQERFDTDSMHSTASATGRITIPANGAGLYLIGGNVEFDMSGYTSGEGAMGVRILANGATVIAQHFIVGASVAPGYDNALPVSTLYSMNAAQYVELQVFTARDVNVLATTAYSPEFYAIWMRRQ